MAVIVNSCPYRVVRYVAPVKIKTVEERFDFQFEENGKIGRVSLGEFDLIEEVDSHKDEVGLINYLKLCQARGIDPSNAAKTEPGLMADVGDIDTLDDLIQAKVAADAKLAQIAASYGISTEQLVQIMQSGDLSSLQEPAPGAEGGENNA